MFANRSAYFCFSAYAVSIAFRGSGLIIQHDDAHSRSVQKYQPDVLYDKYQSKLESYLLNNPCNQLQLHLHNFAIQMQTRHYQAVQPRIIDTYQILTIMSLKYRV